MSLLWASERGHVHKEDLWYIIIGSWPFHYLPKRCCPPRQPMAFACDQTAGLLCVLLRDHRHRCRCRSPGTRTTVWPFPFRSLICCGDLLLQFKGGFRTSRTTSRWEQLRCLFDRGESMGAETMGLWNGDRKPDNAVLRLDFTGIDRALATEGVYRFEWFTWGVSRGTRNFNTSFCANQ